MSSKKKSPAAPVATAAPAGREAALERLKKAEAAVAASTTIFSGKPQTPEQREAFKKALEQLAAATRDVRELGGTEADLAAEAARADLMKRFGTGS